MAQVARSLTVNVQVSDVWTQLLEGSAGSPYSVPSGGSVTISRGDIKLLRAINLSGGSVTCEFAISAGSVISNDERVWGPRIMRALAPATDDSVHVARAGEAVWGKATVTSGSPNVTFRCSILELV